MPGTCLRTSCCVVLTGAMLATLLAAVSDVYAAPPAPARGDSDVPDGSVDLRAVFKNWDLGVRAQGARGTCSVFTVTQALEYAVASQQRRGIRLSVEFLNWASNEAIGEAEDGGYFSDLWKGYAAYGICPEACMPYQQRFDPKLHPSAEATTQARALRKLDLELHWIKPWNPTTGLTDLQFVDIKRTLRRQWPVCGGFRWPKQEQWRGDVLAMAPPEGVRDGHSVLLVGYRNDPAQPGGGVFLLHNSGKGPRNGSMTYEYARTYMNDAVWIGYETDRKAALPGASPHDLLGPFGTAPAGRNRRISSNEQPNWNSSNMDMTWLRPGESVKMPVLEGPGVITHMWFTSHAGWAGELNALSLRIYWDGSKEPAVEAPLADFFAVGQGRPAVVESVPVQVSPTGALTCYWRMPFRKSAKIVITNDNPDRSTGLYWQVDWVQTGEIPPDTPHFWPGTARNTQRCPGATTPSPISRDADVTLAR